MTAWDDYVRSEDGQREYAVTDAEQKVRDAWKVDTTFDSMNGRTIWVDGHRFYSWQAALEFTEARQREIKDLREELEFTEHCDGPGAGRERIIERLRAILSEKRRGMKEEA